MGRKPFLFLYYGDIMKLLRKRADYELLHTKEQAVKELKKDFRVKKIRVTKNRMYIYTKPIIPRNKEFAYIYLAPIGTYLITIRFGRDSHPYRLYARVTRQQGAISNDGYKEFHAPHIMEPWAICWGDNNTEVLDVRDNGDWFWYAKRILSLLDDGGPEGDSPRQSKQLIYFMLRLQMSYLRWTKRPRLYKKVKAEFDRYAKEYDWSWRRPSW